MPEFIPSEKLERTIQAAMDIPEPDAQFLSNLGDRLEAQARSMVQEPPRQRAGTKPFRRPLWQIGLAFILIVLLVVLAIGPQRVLAQVERLLGYIPGVGFIELNGPMILAEPVTLERGDVTVEVDQMVATTEGSLVQFTVSIPAGDPAKKIPIGSGLEFTSSLLLENGREVVYISSSLSGLSDYLYKETFEFPSLPKGTRQVILVFRCSPTTIQMCASGEWRAALTLMPATAEQFEGFLSRPYDPQASATANGVTMRVQQVAHNHQETAVQLQFEWADSTWSWMGGGDPNNTTLSDEYGFPYETKMVNLGDLTSLGFPSVTVVPPRSPLDTPTGEMMTQVETAIFAPLSSATRQLTFSVNSVNFQVPASGEFSLDLGPDPQVGQTWTLDQWLKVAGFDVHLVGARLSEKTGPGASAGQERYYWLEFSFQAAQQAERWLDYFEGEQVTEAPTAWSSRQSAAGGGARGIYLGFGTQYLPQGFLVYRITQAEVTLRGPWQASWLIPGASLQATNLRQASPHEASQEQNGLRLVMEAVQASDVASRVQVAAPGLPGGERLLYVLGWNPLTQPEPARADLYLQDERGRRYELNGGIQQPFEAERYDPTGLQFASLPADASRLTLHVPAVEIEISSQASFMVEVPPGLSYHEETDPVMGKRTVSDAWQVDYYLDAAGYSIHFNHAYVQQSDLLNPAGAYQFVLTGTPLIENQAGRWLRELRAGSIRRPDGSAWPLEGLPKSPYFENNPVIEIAPENPGSSVLSASLRLDATAGNGVDILPGAYEIALDGATVIIPGPWDLNFNLPSN
jgi:hypothetical protein